MLALSFRSAYSSYAPLIPTSHRYRRSSSTPASLFVASYAFGLRPSPKTPARSPRVAEVVQQRQLVPALQQLDRRVRSNVPRSSCLSATAPIPTCQQNMLRHVTPPNEIGKEKESWRLLKRLRDGWIKPPHMGSKSPQQTTLTANRHTFRTNGPEPACRTQDTRTSRCSLRSPPPTRPPRTAARSSPTSSQTTAA